MIRIRNLLLICSFWCLSNQVNEVSSAVSSCHAKLTGSSGTFTSPNYPNSPNAPEKTEAQGGFVTCQWEIEVPFEKGIQLKFGDFNMGAPDYPDDCDKGEVEIYSGVGKEKESLDKYCPGNKPDIATLIVNQSTVVFRRPSTFTGSGFLISFIAITPNEPIDNFVTCSEKVNLRNGEARFSVVCPSGCGNIESHKVYGNLLYRDENTHLCRSAVHAGVISDEFGGKVDVKRLPFGDDLYKSGTANNISALSAPMSDYEIKFPASQICRDVIPLEPSQFTASSYAKTTVDALGRNQTWFPENAVLESKLEQAWSPALSDKAQWIQIDLRAIMHITGVITRGSQTPFSKTELFQVKYSLNSITWHSYKETGKKRAKDFAGNQDYYTKTTNNFVEPVIIARYIRIYPIISPQTCVKRCGLKVALTGCEAPDVSSLSYMPTSTSTSKSTATTKPVLAGKPSLRLMITDKTSLEITTSVKQFISSDRISSVYQATNRSLVLNIHDGKSNEDNDGNTDNENSDDESNNTKIPDTNEKTIVIIAIVAGLGVTCLLLAAVVLVLVRKKKSFSHESVVPKINSRDNATYNTELGMSTIYKNNDASAKRKKRGQNSQKAIDFVNGNYRETLSNATSGTEDSFLNSRGGVTLRSSQRQENGKALPVRASYSTNSDGMPVSGQVGNVLYDERFGNFPEDDDHEYQVIDPDLFPKGFSSHSSNASESQESGGLHGRRSHGNAWNRRSYGDYPQKMTSFAPLDPEESISKPIRSGTLPHRKHNDIAHGDEALPLIPTSSFKTHQSSFPAPKSSNVKPSYLPPKKHGPNFIQHSSTSRPTSSSRNSGSSDQQAVDNSEIVHSEREDAQLLQQYERGRKASYNIPNSIPIGSHPLSTFSSYPSPAVNGGPTLSNGVLNSNSLRHSNSRTESLNHARLRSGYDQLYKATPTSDVNLPKTKISTNEYNQLNLHSSAA